MQRDLLLTRLAPTIRERYREHVLRFPNTTFQMVWDDLSRLSGVDNPHFWRNKWENVKLYCQGDHIEITDFTLFRTRFESALSRVSDYTDTEVVDAILKQLPKVWVDRVLQREANVAKDRFVAKLSGMDMDVASMKSIVERAVGPIKLVEKLKGCFLVEFTTAAQLHHFLSRSDLRINGQALQVQQVRARWRPSDIMDFLSDELRLRDESAVLSRHVDHGRVHDGPRFRPMTRAAYEKKPLTPPSPPPPSSLVTPAWDALHVPNHGKAYGKGLVFGKLLCRSCRQEGRPHDHDWRRCPHAMKDTKPAPKEGSAPVQRDTRKSSWTPPLGKGGKGRGKPSLAQ